MLATPGPRRSSDLSGRRLEGGSSWRCGKSFDAAARRPD